MRLHSLGYLFREGIKSLWKNRSMSIASVAVLISCLLLTGVAGLLSINLSAAMETIEGNNVITVYLNGDISPIMAVKAGEDIRKIDNISECKFVPKDDGLATMMQKLDGDSTLFDALQGDENPLPDAYEISMADLAQYNDTIAAIESVEGVDHISDYSRVANNLSSLDRLVRYCSIAIVVALGIVSLFIISITIKVTMSSRRMEIIIMKSVGATNWFVRLPFIVEGMIIGMLSGAISATVLYFAYDKAVEVVYSLVQFLTVVDIHPYAGRLYALYIVVGMLFGVFGGLISIGRYLKREGEDAVV